MPIVTEHNGIRKWCESNSILNETCPYALLAPGRASIEKGLSLSMPGWGADGFMSYPNGVTIRVYNRNVLALRPLGYKPSPSLGLAASVHDLGIPTSGDWIPFICYGPRRDGDVIHHARELGISACVVPFDIKLGGDSHDITTRRFVDCLCSAIDHQGKARCIGGAFSIRCKTWSASQHLPDSRGNPAKPRRSHPDHILGVPDENGNIPAAISEANTESEHAVEIATCIAKHHGFVIVETPGRRRRGSTHFDWHALSDCDNHAHMLDHPAWLRFRALTAAIEIPWDQCPDAPDPSKAPIKSSLWLATPNIAGAVKLEFGNHICRHPSGTHKALRGTDATGTYLTSSSNCENYHPATCRRIARCFHIFSWTPDSARLDSPPSVVETAAAAPPRYEAAPRPPPKPQIDYELALLNGTFRISSDSAVIRGKHLPDSAVRGELLRRSFPLVTDDDVAFEMALADGDDRALESALDRRRTPALALAGALRIDGATSIIRGKHLPRSAICYEFLHRSFAHGEDRVLRHLPDALCDADDAWLRALTTPTKPPCEACITGDAKRLGPSGELPRDEGLIFLDIMHISIPCIFTGFKIVVGVTHAASRKRKTVRVNSKDQAHLAMEIILAYFNASGKPVTWIHTDGANELKGSHMVPLARSKNIRITCTVKKTSRQNPQEPAWRAQMASTRKILHQSNLPVGFWGAAWDDAEEGQSLAPSREDPHDCALGRLLSTPDKTIKPKGGHRRPFGSLCYPVTSERLPSGTLKNKAAKQATRAILLGYSGGRSGDFEAIGVARSQPGYICYLPDSNSTVVTDDVYICWKIQPGLQRSSGGGVDYSLVSHPFLIRRRTRTRESATCTRNCG